MKSNCFMGRSFGGIRRTTSGKLAPFSLNNNIVNNEPA